MEDVRTIRFGDAHDVADQVHGQLVRDVADEVDVVLLRRGIQDLRRTLRDQLVEASDHPRREPRVHQLAEAGVSGRVRRDDRVPAPLLGRLGEARTLERAVLPPVATDLLELGVAEHGPERHPVGSSPRRRERVVPHRMLVAERREHLVREPVAIEVVRDQVDGELGHFVLLQSGAFAQPVPSALRYQPPAAFVPPSTQSTCPVT